ncbi:MAG TPA: hypothetical protein DD381_10145 [Lentisphaeria bacterium]|nr:MAG: hypothetical protein A2X47_11920 [Lentisphaerae bacterium GWF2_38_69]HBM16685.1 hypothetical protein [Lentisphaeria bacterium]
MNQSSGIIVFKNVVWALLNREFKMRFEKGYLSYLFACGEVFIHVLIWWTIFSFMERRPFLDMELPIFILSGAVPWLFFSKSVLTNLTVFEGTKEFLAYKQVTIFAACVSRILVAVVLTFSGFIIGLLVFSYLGYTYFIYNPLIMFLAFFMMLFLSLGVSLIVSIPGYFFPDFTKIFPNVIRVLYFTSGVFWDISSFPPDIKPWLTWNPLLQIISLFRYSFLQAPLPGYINFYYLWIIIIVTLFLGVGIYFCMRKELISNARPRA